MVPRIYLIKPNPTIDTLSHKWFFSAMRAYLLMFFLAVPALSMPVTTPKVMPMICTELIDEMAGEVLIDETQGLELVQIKSVGAEVNGMIGPVDRIHQERIVRRETAIAKMHKLFEKVYGPSYLAEPLRSRGDNLFLESRTFLRIVNGQRTFKLPLNLATELRNRRRTEDQELRVLETQLNLISAKLGDKREDITFNRVMNLTEELARSMQIMAGSSGFMEPAIKLVYQHSEDYNSVLSYSALLDEAQARLLSFFVKREDTLHMTDSLSNALHDLFAVNFQPSTGFLKPETYEALTKFAGEIKAGDASRWILLGLIQNCKDYGRELVAARKQYAVDDEVATIAFYLLRPPNGDPRLEPGNFLLRARPTSLDSTPNLRNIALCVMEHDGVYMHPTLTRPTKVPDGFSSSALDVRVELLDPVLIRTIDNGHRREAEFQLARRYALEEQIAYYQTMVRAGDWQEIDRTSKAIAHTAVNTVLKPVSRLSNVPTEVASAMLARLETATAPEEPKKAVEKVPTTAVAAAGLPENLPDFANLQTLRLPWVDKDFSLTAAGKEVLDAAKSEEEKKDRQGAVYTYLDSILAELDKESERIIEAHFKKLEDCAKTELPVNCRSNYMLKEEDERVRKVLGALSRLTFATQSCFAQAGRSDEEAHRRIARQIAATCPQLQTLVRTYGTNPHLTRIRAQLFIENWSAAFSIERPRLAPQSHFWERPVETIRRHRKATAVSAAIIVGAGAAAWAFWDRLPRIWPAQDNPPPATAPAATDN